MGISQPKQPSFEGSPHWLLIIDQDVHPSTAIRKKVYQEFTPMIIIVNAG